jgi:DNA-binding NarL/FixJ family response regulator
MPVCLVEYNPLAALYLRELLANDPSLRLYSHTEVLDSQPPLNPAPVFVLDRSTLPTALSKYLRAIRLRYPDAKTIALDDPLPTQELCRLLLLGMQGFLPYGQVDGQLAPAIHAVADGQLWVAPHVLEQYARFSARLSRAKAMKGLPLTRREKRILELVQRRFSNKEISSVLKISEITVKFHLGNVFLKLGVQDRYSLQEAVSPRPLPIFRTPKPK